MFNYSIIIPHHNIPDLLMRCLASIPVREDVQVIVVDDNSADAQTFLERYPELSRPYLDFILTTKGGGAGYARNIGLDHAKGMWLIFADSDDFFVDDFSRMLDEYKSASEDILYFRNLSVLSNDIQVVSHRDDWIENLFNDYFREKDEKIIRCNHCAPWSKMIKKSFIDQHHLRFDEIPFSNDVMFGILSGCQAQQVRIVDRALYVLTERVGSLTSQFSTKPKELETRTEVCFRALKYIRSLGDTYLCRFRQASPPAFYLSRLFHTNKDLYTFYFLQFLDVYPSYPVALKMIRLWESNRIDKLQLYFFSSRILIKRSLKKAFSFFKGKA